MIPSLPGLLQAISLFVVAILIARPLGGYMHRVMEGERVFLSPLLRPVERAIYWILRVDETVEQNWKAYAVSVIVFSFVCILALYLQQRLQAYLPLNQGGVPGIGPVAPDLSYNTAVSFDTNTNWQNYLGEQTMTYLTQMAGLAVRNFVSAATGIAVALALTRGLVRRSATTIGNFWVDLTRGTLYILLPIAFVGALVLVSQGVIQTFASSITVHTLQGAVQTIPLGPVASQEAIKELGTNGGGFFNANSAHPFENPTGFTNWFEMLLILIIPFALTFTFGRMAGNARQGWALLAVMIVILSAGSLVAMASEERSNPSIPAAVAQNIDQSAGNMEGKEVRFGADSSGLFATVTTGTSTGAVDSMHDSFLPVGGLVPLFNIELGEITPGGVGAGLYGILVFAIIGVFIAGLMVGRTPEFLGKKIEAYEMKMAMLVVLFLAFSILFFTALATATAAGKAGPLNGGPHGFSEILYAFSSQTGNNGSAFAGLTGNTLFYNVTGAFAMMLGRYAMIVPILAIAGSMAGKRRVAPSLGTFPTTGPIWVGLLLGVIIIVGALTFFPALSLGPIVDQLLNNAGRLF
ncbi:MAG TPA: potassium-transporting ATPase subunit KdpA [Candidatus Limnocylindrales bacterium]|jgi:K+-transporting ATPase ATPase A chain